MDMKKFVLKSKQIKKLYQIFKKLNFISNSELELKPRIFILFIKAYKLLSKSRIFQQQIKQK